MKSVDKKDLLASFVVFLVALPLCMGIAIASGVPPALGLISGIVGGIVIGTLSGSPLQVSGPAAGLAVMVWQIVDQYGVRALGWAVLVVGAIQLASGFLKLGRWFRAVSPAVIHGMLAGIGVLIFASQFHVMVDDKPAGSGVTNLLTIPQAIYKGVVPAADTAHHVAALVGLATIVTIVLWNRYRPEALTSIPGPLLAILVASGGAFFASASISYVEVPANLLNALNVPGTSEPALFTDVGFWASAAAMSLIASAETLLSATATDKMHDGVRTNYDKELIAQGIGNTICGVLGALPVTGVIVRSSANVETGAKTRLSAMLHGVWLLAFVVVFPSVLNLIPTAALAGILVYIGYRLVKPERIVELWKAGKAEAGIYAATVVGIVAVDLLTGVAIGFGLALIRLLYTFLHLEVDVQREGQRVDFTLRGAATFLQLPRIAEAIESLRDEDDVHLHLAGLSYADHAILELLGDWESRHPGHLAIEWDELRRRSRGQVAGQVAVVEITTPRSPEPKDTGSAAGRAAQAISSPGQKARLAPALTNHEGGRGSW